MCSAIFWRMLLIGSTRVLARFGAGQRRHLGQAGCAGAGAGCAAAGAAERLRSRGCGRGAARPGAARIRFDIRLRDSSAGAGALHLAQVDVVLARHRRTSGESGPAASAVIGSAVGSRAAAARAAVRERGGCGAGWAAPAEAGAVRE